MSCAFRDVNIASCSNSDQIRRDNPFASSAEIPSSFYSSSLPTKPEINFSLNPAILSLILHAKALRHLYASSRVNPPSRLNNSMTCSSYATTPRVSFKYSLDEVRRNRAEGWLLHAPSAYSINFSSRYGGCKACIIASSRTSFGRSLRIHLLTDGVSNPGMSATSPLQSTCIAEVSSSGRFSRSGTVPPVSAINFVVKAIRSSASRWVTPTHLSPTCQHSGAAWHFLSSALISP